MTSGSSLSNFAGFSVPDMSTDLLKEGFVPVKPAGHKLPPFQPRSCDTQNFMAKDCFHPANNHFDQLSSPFNSPELAFTTAAVAPEFVPEQTVKPDGTSEDFVAYEPSDISLETASSTERALFAGANKYNTEGKGKKKVGRPIAYKGDPNATNLTEAEMRRIKRRIANRESARRVRARRQETLEELQVRMDQISASNASMLKHIADVSGHTMLLKGQLQECELRWNRATADNVRLHQQVSLLSTKLEEQNANAVVAATNTEPVEPVCGASTYSTAPVTGISCDLIDVLPTMALPMPKMMLGGLFDGYDQESCDFLN